MANEEHLAILKQGVGVWNQWRRENPLIQPDLSEENLREADLSGADLSGADLHGVDLHGANLRKADLSGTDLSGANLNEADLSGANLSGAHLIGADLIGSYLGGADLSGTDLGGANLERITVGWSRFGDVDLSVVKGLDTVEHLGPSTVGIDTIYESKGKVPEVFLRGCGIPDQMIAFIASLPGQPDTYRAKLRMMIDKHFDRSELQTLCFDMGVDYDGLNGENKSDKARELVAYFQRRGTIRDLVAKCKVLRPKASWEGEYE